ncbi:MAG: anaerobic ribonucleoside-triphosphate reductase activating protein [Exilibacterium sp.]
MLNTEENGLRIGGLVPVTTVDFPGELAAVVFCQGCPWRCRYCHNPHLIPRKTGSGRSIQWNAVVAYLKKRRGLLDGVVFSGGEPTTQKTLLPAVKVTYDLGFKIALHTGAPDIDRLKPLLPYLSWVGLDIKALPQDYHCITQIKNSGADSWAAIALLKAAGIAFECRTTWHASLQSVGHLISIALELKEAGVTHYSVQIAGVRHCLDTSLQCNSLAKEVRVKLVNTISPWFECFELKE